MRFEFDIPKPESCLKCRFGALESTKDPQAPWIFRCLVDKNLFVPLREGMHERNKQCPGKLDFDELEDGELNE